MRKFESKAFSRMNASVRRSIVRDARFSLLFELSLLKIAFACRQRSSGAPANNRMLRLK